MREGLEVFSTFVSLVVFIQDCSKYNSSNALVFCDSYDEFKVPSRFSTSTIAKDDLEFPPVNDQRLIFSKRRPSWYRAQPEINVLYRSYQSSCAQNTRDYEFVMAWL